MAVEVTPAQAAAVMAARERYTDAEFISWLEGALAMNAEFQMPLELARGA